MIGALIGWWYGIGWKLRLGVVKRRWLRWADYFSFSLLCRTLFAPFRQIGTDSVGGSLDVQFRQWSDRTFSRVIGFVVRIFTLVFGFVCMLVLALLSVSQLVGWLAVPAAPLIGLVLSILRWLPWQS